MGANLLGSTIALVYIAPQEFVCVCVCVCVCVRACAPLSFGVPVFLLDCDYLLVFFMLWAICCMEK